MGRSPCLRRIKRINQHPNSPALLCKPSSTFRVHHSPQEQNAARAIVSDHKDERVIRTKALRFEGIARSADNDTRCRSRFHTNRHTRIIAVRRVGFATKVAQSLLLATRLDAQLRVRVRSACLLSQSPQSGLQYYPHLIKNYLSLMVIS